MRSILFYAWLGFTWAQYTLLGKVQNDNIADTTRAYKLKNGMEIHTQKSGSGEACARQLQQAVRANVKAYAMVASTLFRMDFDERFTGIVLSLRHKKAIRHLQFQTQFIPEAYQLKYLLITYIQRVSPRHVLLNLYFVQNSKTNIHPYFVANTFFQYIIFLKRARLTSKHVHPTDLIGTTTSSKSQTTADFSIRSLFLPPRQAYKATGLYSPFNGTEFTALLNSLTPQNARLACTIPKFTKDEMEITPISKPNYHLGRINPKAFRYNLLSEKELLIPKPHDIFHQTYYNEYITRHELDLSFPKTSFLLIHLKPQRHPKQLQYQ
ncbi:hypothetical protein DSO57_1030875 [Entomophthora muscae]|uniref:Uncharacterized protein n=1 Tax=Entomophthora muscae TaxID=34485 RepID=A0ACC2TZG0_9FUNG|nr:hypothetical protein DSO57_1030875 [Entomophthora muscae]